MSANTKKVIPSITKTSTVPELIKHMWLSFQPPDCSEVEAILLNRENELKMELEKLRKDNLSLKTEYELMEKKHGLAELKKLKYESQLMASKRECQELNEKSEKYAQMLRAEENNKRTIVSEFSEKVKVLCEEKLERDERLAKLIDELKVAEEKHHIRIMVEKDNSRIIAECKEKIKVLEGDKLKMEGKMVELIKELKDEKKMVEEKNQMLIVLEKDKSRFFSEFKEKIDGLEREKLLMEEKLAKSIEELNNEKKMTEEKVEKEKRRIFTVCSVKINDLEKEKLESEEKLVKLTEELNDEKKKHGNLMVKKEKSMIASKFSEKMLDRAFTGDTNVAEKVKKGVNSRDPILIDLTESDDDCVTNNEEFERVIDKQYSRLKRKRSIYEEGKDEVSVSVQTLRSLLSSDDGNISCANTRESIDCDKGKLPFIKQCNNKAETEGNPDPAYSNSFVSRDREYKWIYEADMLSSFTKDPQLCMNAVCALYRQQFSSHKSIKKGGFSVIDSSRGAALARYFINSDPENRLSRSVSEVREKCPEMLEDCKRLAIDYYKQLFEIYKNKLDPFFPKSKIAGSEYAI